MDTLADNLVLRDDFLLLSFSVRRSITLDQVGTPLILASTNRKYVVLPWLFLASLAFAQQPAARTRIIAPIDNRSLVTLRGNRHPLARPEFDHGLAPDTLQLNRMLLLLSRTPEQQAALDKLVQDQHTPDSPNYRKWLSPAELGQQFGIADGDVQTISSWLAAQGFTVRHVSGGKSLIEFSGSAAQVRQAFHTDIHKYVVNGEEHWANAQDPQIPAALAAVVEGPISLNNFRRHPLAHRAGAFSRDGSGIVKPALTVSNGTSTYYAIAPADFATIYNSNPLLQAGTNGAGQTVAVIGRSNVRLQDIADYRNLFGLGTGNTSVILDGPDPGIVESDESESVLDLERVNGTAPGATVLLVSAQDTETTSGIDLAALYAVENNLAGVISVSYGECEAHFGTAQNQYIESLWEQASAQGITVVVSSGDSGSAGCDNPNVEDVAQSGLAVNALASTRYNVAVGGTDFDDVGKQSSYWNSTNAAGTLSSALSYIPETTWNESCAASATAGNLTSCPAAPSTGPPPASLLLWAGSGGASNCTTSSSQNGTLACQNGRPKPSWQSGVGVPADGVRDVPDVSLFASAGSNSNSFYVVCQADALPAGFASCQQSAGQFYFIGAGGTSASAPGFAGIVALAEQKTGARLGNLNYLLYSLAAGSGASCASASSGSGCLFNDIVKGNNSVPCQAGTKNCSQTAGSATGVLIDASQNPAYTTGAGYDLATGLGSVNAANLVTAIANAVGKFSPTATALTLNGSSSALTLQHGSAVNVAVSVSPGSATGDVSLLGGSGSFDFNPLAGGIATWTSTLFPGGSYTVKAHYPGDGARAASDSNAVPVTINPESSLSFVNLVTFDNLGNLQSFTGNAANYGSPYIVRADVADSSGSVSSAQGVNSKCASHTASCPTGTVTLTANGSPLDGGSFKLNSKGFAEDQAIQLPAGSYALSAVYPGDASYTASTGNSTVTIAKAPTNLAANIAFLPPYGYGENVQVNATLSTTSSGAIPTGNITFQDNGASAAADISSAFQHGSPGGATGYANVAYSAFYAPPSVGTHTLTAQYAGDSNYSNSASAPFSITVGKGTTLVETYGIRPTAATPSLPVTLNITIFTHSSLNQPTGTVTFTDNGNPISGTVTYGGQAGSCCTIASLTAQITTQFATLGNHDIAATYSGDANYNSVSQDFGNLTVSSKLPAVLNAVTSSMNPALVNYPTNLTISVVSPSPYGGTPAPTGTFTFSDNGQPLTGTIVYSSNSNSLTATLPYSFGSGSHSITASYSGDSNYGSATSSQPLALSVISTIPTTIPNLDGASYAANQPFTLIVDVNSNYIYNGPVMTGTVTFQDGNNPIPGTVTYGGPQEGVLVASVPYTFTTPGTHSVTVQYSGDSHYAPSSNTFQEVVFGPLGLQLPPGENNVTVGSGGGVLAIPLTIYDTVSTPMTVTLSCNSSSSAATCSVSPSTQNVFANGASGVTVNIRVPGLSGKMNHVFPFGTSFVFAAVFGTFVFSKPRKSSVLLAMCLALTVFPLASCGGGGGGTGGPSSGTGSGGTVPTSQTYTFTITGTSGSNTATQTVTVAVQ